MLRHIEHVHDAQINAQVTAFDNVHIMLALIIMATYIAIPFTSMRRLPLTNAARTFAIGFFLTCAVTHLAVAAKFHEEPFMLYVDLVQAVSAIGFTVTLNRQMAAVLARREAARRQQHRSPPGA